MKKIFSYLIVIAITYGVAAYINNPELRKKINNLFQRTPQEVVVKNMYVKHKLVYVKKEPLDTAEILGTLRKGTEVGLITTQEKWAKIKTPAGVSGWVSISSLSEQPVQVSKKEAAKKEKAPPQEEQIYQDLSSSADKIPSSVISIFDTQAQPTEEVPDIIKQELQSRQTTTKTTTQQKAKTSTKTEQQKVTQETPPVVSVSTPTQQETIIQEKPKKSKKETTITKPSSETEEIIKCPNCEAEVIKGERFCPICRELLTK